MTQCVVHVNDKPLTIAANASVEALVAQLELPQGAAAVAVNQEIIAREKWPETILNEGDQIALFQAIAGG
ncbi:sulfur carrier protein ThiS [Thaumasiovibrio subtropicus]|uniref:sulfur carrier protein ThiS n=1 Tax=Thaumasiovibrio subtropicus TaxID=1891207 RepID=UPI000B34BF68|nr:sulfur carrier protein ThiS [Thaumasiovibrio subtropicus]